MEAVIISKEHYEALQTDLTEIKEHVKKIVAPNESFVDNKRFTKMMGISYRTAQTWRDEGKIGFSQEGKKIYYRLSDIEKFMKDYHHKPFAIQEKIGSLVR